MIALEGVRGVIDGETRLDRVLANEDDLWSVGWFDNILECVCEDL